MTGPAVPVEHEYRVLFTDVEVTGFIGLPVDDIQSAEIELRFNEVSSATIACPAFPWLQLLILTPGIRAAIVRDGAIIIAGPVESSSHTFDAEADGEDGIGRMVITIADDLSLVAGRVTYPNPALDANVQDAARYTITGAVGSSAIHELVNLNAGPGSLRPVAALTMAADPLAGDTIDYSTRFEPLLDACRAIALAVGGIGFRTRQVGLAVQFEIYDPGVSGQWSRARGNLRGFTFTTSSPNMTVVLVGGQDAGADRTIRETDNTTALIEDWPRVETFLDRRDQDDPGELDQAGDAVWLANGPAVRLDMRVIDTAAQKWPDDYDLGALGSVEVYDGVTVEAIVRVIKISYAAATGETITPVIGTPDAVASGPTAALRQATLRQQALDATAGELPV